MYGFIAQQVEEHFPEAVGRMKDFIPNIYALLPYTCINGIATFTNVPDLSGIFQRIRIIDYSDTEYDLQIVSVGANTISVDMGNTTLQCDPSQPNMLFVYGTEVSDFHTLNKSSLFTINFAATQDIDRIIQQQEIHFNELAQKNIALLEQIAEIKQYMNMP